MIIGEYIDVYPPTLDGVGTVVKSYCESLTALGHDCYYIAPNNPAVKPDFSFNTLLYNGIKVPTEPYHFGLPMLDLRFLQDQRKIEFDILHAHSPFASGLEALRKSDNKRIPIVATFHSKYYDDFLQKTHSHSLASLGTWFVVNFYNKCDEVWTVNDMTAEVLRSYGYKKDIFIMPNGTNIIMPTEEARNDVDSTYNIQKDESVLLFVGQMSWKKNIRLVLDSFALYSKTTRARLLMVGQGPDEKAIHDYAEELGINERVIYTGHIADRNRLLGIFSRCDFFIFPSIYDNAPMVVREAASVCTPSILMRDTCASEGITDGYNGLLCDNTPESICECIARGKQNYEEIGRNAQKTIPIPWSGIAEKVVARYEQLIDMKRSERE